MLRCSPIAPTRRAHAIWLLLVVMLAHADTRAQERVRLRTLTVPEVGVLTYGISVPAASRPRPLVLALHPGEHIAGYGSRFMQQMMAPALTELNALMVGPDCPTRSWNDPNAERALLALIEQVRREHPIDPKR